MSSSPRRNELSAYFDPKSLGDSLIQTFRKVAQGYDSFYILYDIVKNILSKEFKSISILCKQKAGNVDDPSEVLLQLEEFSDNFKLVLISLVDKLRREIISQCFQGPPPTRDSAASIISQASQSRGVEPQNRGGHNSLHQLVREIANNNYFQTEILEPKKKDILPIISPKNSQLPYTANTTPLYRTLSQPLSMDKARSEKISKNTSPESAETQKSDEVLGQGRYHSNSSKMPTQSSYSSGTSRDSSSVREKVNTLKNHIRSLHIESSNTPYSKFLRQKKSNELNIKEEEEIKSMSLHHAEVTLKEKHLCYSANKPKRDRSLTPTQEPKTQRHLLNDEKENMALKGILKKNKKRSSSKKNEIKPFSKSNGKKGEPKFSGKHFSKSQKLNIYLNLAK